MFKRLKNIEDNLIEVDIFSIFSIFSFYIFSIKVGIFRIIKDIKDKGIKIDNDDEAIDKLDNVLKN